MPLDDPSTSARRTFISQVAAGALALAAVPAASAIASTVTPADDDPWIKALKGKHKQVFDAPDTNAGFPFMFAATYLQTMMEHYKLAATEVSAMVVVRHFGTGMGLNDSIWKKYNLGKMLNVLDPATKAPATRNIFYKSKPGDMMNIDASADKIIAKGVVVGVCGFALKALSGMAAEGAGMKADAAHAEWIAGVIPGAFVLPSGVLGVAKAQEAGCTYCYAG
jgi:intracellular sulfur oxidation DsrE/DsrF family protein